MTTTEIAEDEALIAKATPGPWQARFMYRLFRSVREHAATLKLWVGGAPEQDWPDADFCAAARTRWPLYVAEVKRLMKRDEPAKVTWTVPHHLHFAKCGACEFPIRTKDIQMPFCPNCGQRLEWS